MIQSFNEESIKLFRSKIFLFLNYTIPGVVALEIFFKKGFFSAIPASLYEFILYIVWSFILSLPYNFFPTVNCNDLFDHIKKKKLEKEEHDEIKKIDELIREDKETIELFDSRLQFIFTLLYPFSTYMIYKGLIRYFHIKPFWSINTGLMTYIICVIIIYSIILPFFRLVFKNSLINLFEKKINE